MSLDQCTEHIFPLYHETFLNIDKKRTFNVLIYIYYVLPVLEICSYEYYLVIF